MASNQTNALGTAEGVIKIDVSSLQAAGEVIKQFAAQTMAAFSPLSEAMMNFAAITKNATTIAVQQLKNEAVETEAAADIEIAAIKAKSVADEDATKLAIQMSKERISQLNAEADESEAVAQQKAQSQAQLSNPGARGLSRAAFSVGFAASSLGLQDVGQAAFGVGGLTAVIGELPVFSAQLQALAGTLTGMGGIIGQVATLGATLAGSLGAVLAVALPIAAVFIGLALVVKKFADDAQSAADQLKAAQAKATAVGNEQAQVNQQIAAGATSSDIQAQLDVAKQKRALDQATYEDLATQKDALVKAGQDTSVLDAQIKALPLGQDKIAVDALSAALYNQTVLNNDVIASYDTLAKAESDEADFRQQIAGENSQQLRKQLADAQTNARVLPGLIELSSGKQKEAYREELTALQGVTDASGKYVVVQGQIADLQNALLAANIKEFFQSLVEFAGKLGSMAGAFAQTTQRTGEDRAIAATNRVFDNLEQQARSAEDFTRQRAQEMEDENRSMARAAQDFALAQEKSERDFNENKAKEQRDYDEQAQQAEQDHQQKLAKITSDSRLQILQDAANLDARAVYNDQQKRNKQIADENDTYTRQRDQRAAAFQQQLDDQQAQYDQQRQDAQDQYDLQRQRAIADFNERLSREDQQRALQQQRAAQDDALQLQRQQQQYALLDARRLQDYQQQVAQLIAHYQNLQDIARVGLAGLASLFLGFFQPHGTGDTSIFPTRDSGGAGFAGRGYMIGTKELFFPNSGGTFVPLGGAQTGRTLNWTGDLVLGDIGDRSDAQVMALIDKGLRSFFYQGVQPRTNS